MNHPQTLPFGSWKSPITANDVYTKSIKIGGIQMDQDCLYWKETRPDGRTVIVKRSPDGYITDLTPSPYDVRTRVHEYGGGDYLAADGIIYFSNFSDQRMYRQTLNAEPKPLTQSEGKRYADAILDRQRNRLIAVREDHTSNAPQPVNTLVSIRLSDMDETILISGNDFYSNPRLSQDDKYLSWLTWNHPNMPWDGTELWVCEIRSDNSLGERTLIAGSHTESILQPVWSPDGGLYFVSDRTGWWNLYRWQAGRIESLLPMEAEFGQPQWTFGKSTFAMGSADRLICTYVQNGQDYLAVLDTRSLTFKKYDIPYTSIDELLVISNQVYFIGGSSTTPKELVKMNLVSAQIEVVRRVQEANIDPAYIASAQALEFPTDSGLTAHGFFYAPTNRDFTGPTGELPPLLVMCHGGPTSKTSTVLRYGIQYWTTRGFAVLDVNYGGSTGYGRAYRERLNGQMGVVDVADCVNGARYLVSQGMVDGSRLAITGGSAGGFITLCAITFYDTFKAGASYFGISDLEALAKDTHKFESRYLDGLVGPYPEQHALYIDRSPIHHIQKLACPIIILQGLDDPVVPPSQSQAIYEAARARGLPVTYLTFPGERHGFLKAENNKQALEAEMYFYSKIFKFELAEAITPIYIENL